MRVVPPNSPKVENHRKSQGIRQYRTGPMFLNPLIYWAIVTVVTDSLIGPRITLIVTKEFPDSRSKSPVRFTGIFEGRLPKPMVRRGLSR